MTAQLPQSTALAITLATCFLFAIVMETQAAESILERTDTVLKMENLWFMDFENVTQQIFTPLTSLSDFHANFWIIVNALVSVCLAYFIYKCAVKPLNRVRRLEDVGYIPNRGQTLKDTANLVRKRRQTGDIPPVYPNGWFGIAESNEIEVGQVKAVSCLGKSRFVDVDFTSGWLASSFL